jgi:hypothetical protein
VNQRRRRHRGRRATDSNTFHRYGAIGDQTLYVGVLYAAGVNVDSLTYYIGAGGGAHCPLLRGLPRSGQEGGLGPLWPKPIGDQLQYSPP